MEWKGSCGISCPGASWLFLGLCCEELAWTGKHCGKSRELEVCAGKGESTDSSRKCSMLKSKHDNGGHGYGSAVFCSNHSVQKGAKASNCLQVELLGKKHPSLSQDISTSARSASQGFKQGQVVTFSSHAYITSPSFAIMWCRNLKTWGLMIHP